MDTKPSSQKPSPEDLSAKISDQEFDDVTDQEDACLKEELVSDEGHTVEEEIADIKDQLMRALAEAENVRRRAAQDKQDALKYGLTSFVRDLLAVSDNLRRAIEHAPETLPDELKTFVEGVELTEKELNKLYDKHGIKKVDPLGEKFNSHLHQAMFEAESDEHEPGTVMQVIQPGYTIHDRLIRPAMVGVVKKKG